MQIVETDGFFGRCVSRGVERMVRLMMLDEDPAVGDWVLVHIDNAVRRLSEDEVETVNTALDAIAASADGRLDDMHDRVAALMADVELPSAREDG